MNLWGLVVKNSAGDSKVLVPEDRDLLITRLALAPGCAKQVPNVVSFKNHDQDNSTIVIGTLRAESVEQFEVDINICAGAEFSIAVNGPGEIHLSGYYNRLMYQGESEESYSFSDDSRDEVQENRLRKFRDYLEDSTDSSDGEDYKEEGGNVETLSSSTDMDEEEGVKSPVKQKTGQQIQANKPGQPSTPKPQPGIQTKPATPKTQGQSTPNQPKPQQQTPKQQQSQQKGQQKTPNQQGKQSEQQGTPKPKGQQNPSTPKQEEKATTPKPTQASQPNTPKPNIGSQPNTPSPSGEGKKKKKKKKNKNKGEQSPNQQQSKKRENSSPGGGSETKKQKTQ